jgi:2-iminobutanoate/2-iminopropanoate deaminase
MSRRAVVTSAAPPPAGTYSQAIRSDGPLVFISGQTPRTLDGRRLIGVPFERQARLALDNLEAIAQAAGLSLRNAVKVDVFLRDLKDRAEFDVIYATYVGEPLPARTLAQSNFTEFDVEVSAVLLDRGGMPPGVEN